MKFYRIVCLLIILIMAVSVFATPVFAENEIKVILDGTELAFDVPPRIVGDRTLVPMRAIFEALGATVEWDDQEKTAIADKLGIIIYITIGKNVMVKNCCDVVLDTPAQLIDGRTMVPVRAIAESFGVDVLWDDATRTVYLTDKNILQSVDIADGVYYDGEVMGGMPAGYGTMYIFSDDVEIINLGLWSGTTQIEGGVFMYYKNGDSFSGYIVNDQLEGYAELYDAANGVTYEFEFSNGELVQTYNDIQ